MYKIKLSPYHKIFYNEWKLDPSSSKYNIVFDQTISSNLDIIRLKAALNKFVSEYLLLNSHIIEVDGEPYWVKNLRINVMELFNDSYTYEQIFKYISQPFNLNSKPLYRFAVFKETNDNYRFIAVLHHLIMDGAAVDIFISNLSNYYNSSKHSSKQSLAEQLKIITTTTEKLDKQVELNTKLSADFWESSLAECEILDLRFLKLYDIRMPTPMTNIVKELEFNFNKTHRLQLGGVLRKYGITEYIYSQCIFAVLLHRYTSQNKFAISYPIAIKDGANFICGAKINTNIIPFAFNDKTTILDLFSLNKNFIKSLKAGKFNYSYFPIYKIISVTNVSLLEVTFAQTNLKNTRFDFTDVKTLAINNEFNIDLFTKLCFEQEVKDQTLYFRVKYNSLETDAAILEQFIAHYKKLFINILEDLISGIDDKLIARYQILLPEEYKQIVYDWNNTDTAYPQDKTIHQLFEEQVIKTPDSIALVYEDKKLTYNELNSKANQLTYYLVKTYSIKPEDLIALCLARNEYMIISILAILKTGGAYVPIDPDCPCERVTYILNDTKAQLLITNEDLPVIPETPERGADMSVSRNPDLNILIIDSPELQNKLNKQLTINLNLNIKGNNLAYVIYTSGTTGKPKGVLQQHNNVTRLFTATDKLYRFNNRDIWLLFHSYTFDFAVWEMFGALIYGGKLIITNHEYTRDLYLFYELCKSERVTILNVTPSVFYLLSEIVSNKSDNDKLTKLRYIIFGGEALNFTKLKLWLDIYGDRNPVLVNMYGTTETTIHSSYKVIKRDEIYNGSLIGRVLSDQTTYILDRYFNVLPIGAIGELYIGGAGLTRGYLNQPDLTQDIFNLKDYKDKNGKLYKTGDLVRRFANGEMEYIGRNDSQVKINGYRIELREIEKLLNTYDEIVQSLAVVFSSAGINNEIENKYLIVYYIAKNKINELKLKKYLSQYLPVYMIPRVFTYINKIPLTTNGKINYQALPQPELIVEKIFYVPPNNNLESLICRSYAQILKLPPHQVGIDHDFFELGGNSILAISLVAKLQRNCKINVNDIFELRTPAKIAECALLVQDNLKNKLNQLKRVYRNINSYKEKDKKLVDIKKQYYWQEIERINFNSQLKPIKNILLTGVTGHLGCNVLYQVLTQTKYTIYLLVRADSTEHAYFRTNAKYKNYFDDDLEHYKHRIVVLSADLEKPNLGLSKLKYQKLVENIDSIIHSAALVKHYGNYEEFYQANIRATVNLLELAKKTQLKDFHYISTIGILMEGYIPDSTYYTFTENDSGEILHNRSNLYTQTKYEGEQATLKYRAYGVQSNIYRVGNLAMNSDNYRNQENIENNAFYIRVKTMLGFGMIPKELASVEVSPVNCTALAIIKLFDQIELSNNTYHLFNPYKVNLPELFTESITQVSLDNFIDKILKHLEDANNREAIELFMLHQGWLQDVELSYLTKIDILSDKTNYILAKLGFNWPHITYAMFADFMQHCLHGVKNNG